MQLYGVRIALSTAEYAQFEQQRDAAAAQRAAKEPHTEAAQVAALVLRMVECEFVGRARGQQQRPRRSRVV